MAKKTSESAPNKKGSISSATRGRVSSKTINGVVKTTTRSSTKTTLSRSMERGSKLTQQSANVSSQKTKGNLDDHEGVPTKRPPRSSRKRNSSVQESSDYSSNKKPKVDSSQQQKEETNPRIEGSKPHSLQRDTKKAGPYKQSHNKEKNGQDFVPKRDSKQENKGEGKKENSTEVKQKSPLKCTHEITPQNTQVSPRKDKHVKKKLDLDLMQSVGKQCATKQEADISSSEESSDDEGVAWEDVDEAHVAEHVVEAVHKGDHEASTSHRHSPSKKSVEISITMPGPKKKKKGWDQEAIMKCVKRAINRLRKETLINVHKVHLLTLVAHGIFRNGVCNDPLLQAFFLSHVPSDFLSGNKRKWDVARLTSFLQWFQSKFSSTDDAKTGEREADKQIAKVENLSEVLVAILRALGLMVRLVYSVQPISVKGDFETKSSQKNQKKRTPTAVYKPNDSPHEETSKTPARLKKGKVLRNKDVKEESEVETKKRTGNNSSSSNRGIRGGKGAKTLKTLVGKSAVRSSTESKGHGNKVKEEILDECIKTESKELNKRTSLSKLPRGNTKLNKKSLEAASDARDGKKNEKKNKRPLRKRKKVDYSLCDGENETDGEEEWGGLSSSSDSEEEREESGAKTENFKKRSKTPLARSERSTESDSETRSGNNKLSFVDLVDDDSDFEVTSKPLVRRRPSGGSAGGKRKALKIISSDESSDNVQCLGDSNWWSEVYLPVEKKWLCVHLESSSVDQPELCENQATQPLAYVVSFDNKNAVKDVTNRYASSWMSKTRKLRIDSDWWEDTLRPYKSKNKKMDKLEDSHLEDKLLEKPLPTSITEFKNHPLYVLKRHLLKFEAIYPESAAILGYCRGEAVYSRDCVHLLHTREKWLNEALVVKQGEQAYKVVKGRPKRNQPIHERDSVTIDLFGRWQTERYKPPPAKNGKVPRNEYGNVELFQPCMLPPGTKHIQINGIQRVAKKLGIDCAQAVVGFDFHCGFSHPVIDGVVVCKEFEQVLLDAWREEEEQAEKRRAEKREKRMLANWKLLTRSLLIRERLKKRYDTEEPKMTESSKSAEGEAVTDTSVAWPLNRQEGKTSVASDGHCHVFPESGHKQDSVTGEWTKSCSCGLTLAFEKM